MIMAKSALLGVLLLGLVSAECGTGETATLSGYPGTRTQDTPWEGLGCKTFTGSIALATDVAWGAFGIYEIEEITGSFVAHDSPQLKDVSFPNLRKLETLSLKNPDIGAFLDVRRLEELETLELSQLWYSGGMGWRINITRISSFVVEETFIVTLTADQDWDPSYSSFRSLKTADDIRIERNPQMGTISLPELTSVTNSLIIGYNSILDHTYFPALEWAGSITIRGNGLNIHPASAAILDLPILTEVKGLFNVSDNPRMEEISLPALQKVDGALLLEDNPTLRNLSFPSLETISGDVLIRGNNLSSFEFPALKSVGGSFTIHSLVEGFNCSNYENIRSLVSGDFRCDDNIPLPRPTSTSALSPTPAATSSITTPTPSSTASTIASNSTAAPQTGAVEPLWKRDDVGLLFAGVALVLGMGSCLLL